MDSNSNDVSGSVFNDDGLEDSRNSDDSGISEGNSSSLNPPHSSWYSMMKKERLRMMVPISAISAATDIPRDRLRQMEKGLVPYDEIEPGERNRLSAVFSDVFPPSSRNPSPSPRSSPLPEWANNLKTSRKLKLRMNQVDFAECIGVTVAMLAKYESGEKFPDEHTAEKITELLGCSVFSDNDILNGRVTPRWAQRLRDARLNKGMTQKQAAAEIGITQSEISFIENGKRRSLYVLGDPDIWKSYSDFVGAENMPSMDQLVLSREFSDEKRKKSEEEVAPYLGRVPEQMKIWGKDLRAERISRRMSQSELAGLLNLTQARISRLEQGKCFTREIMAKIRVVLGRDVFSPMEGPSGDGLLVQKNISYSDSVKLEIVKDISVDDLLRLISQEGSNTECDVNFSCAKN